MAAQVTPYKPAELTKSQRRKAWGQRVRERIDSTLIAERVERCALGLEEMTQTELTAARILLDRTVPTFKPLEVEQGSDVNAKVITNSQLLDFIEGKAERIK